jgi:hypothetical protein
MTRSNLMQSLVIAVARAAKVHSSLSKRSISPHTMAYDSNASTTYT